MSKDLIVISAETTEVFYASFMEMIPKSEGTTVLDLRGVRLRDLIVIERSRFTSLPFFSKLRKLVQLLTLKD